MHPAEHLWRRTLPDAAQVALTKCRPGGCCPAVHAQPHPDTGPPVYLTTAHLNHTPEDVREINLLAACQRCHLRLDQGRHRVTRSRTLAARQPAAGRLSLLPDTDLVRTEPPTRPGPTHRRTPDRHHPHRARPEGRRGLVTTKARKRHPTQPTEPKYDPSFLVPTVHSDLWTYPTQGLCPCGTMAPVYDGILGLHMPATEWSDGHRRPVISDAYGSAGCRYGLRTVTLEAALQRDNMLGPVEQHVLRYDRDLFEQGWVFTAPQGYSLPTPIANLFALAEANGWATVQEWVPTVDDGGYVLNLRVGRSEDWRYDLCLFATPDVVYETCCGKSNTPDNPHLHETPPIKKIRAVIRKNPLPEGADHPFVGSPHLWYIDNSHSSWWLP